MATLNPLFYSSDSIDISTIFIKLAPRVFNSALNSFIIYDTPNQIIHIQPDPDIDFSKFYHVSIVHI